MNTGGILVTILIVCAAIFWALVYNLQSSIKRKIERFQTGREKPEHMSPQIFLPVKFRLADEYPQKEILKLSRWHDRLINYFYISLLIIILTSLVGYFIQEVV